MTLVGEIPLVRELPPIEAVVLAGVERFYYAQFPAALSLMSEVQRQLAGLGVGVPLWLLQGPN